ncbi:permease of the major facilitator superfamily [Penicillium brevicompactum]|uniref:Permease of the major facilitator superfamily n=1 Tax=Penicillium brevicompactum TaxID=5074 RepID=A0A9W9QA88_PENBR|nr:permease of the major facilitator superfamily [Penicillium brevicompactum]
MFGILGQTGPNAGSRFFPKEEGPYYVNGIGTSVGLLFFAAVLAQVLALLARWKNQRRDTVHGSSDPDWSDDTGINSDDDHPSFRFTV